MISRRSLIKLLGNSSIGMFILFSHSLKDNLNSIIKKDSPLPTAKDFYYKNINIQTRTNVEQPFFWSVRPFGKANKNDCLECQGIISEHVEISPDQLVMTVTTIWESKASFLLALPPEHFEQPGFDQWHRDNNVTFSYTEHFISNKNS